MSCNVSSTGRRYGLTLTTICPGRQPSGDPAHELLLAQRVADLEQVPVTAVEGEVGLCAAVKGNGRVAHGWVPRRAVEWRHNASTPLVQAEAHARVRGSSPSPPAPRTAPV